MLDLLISGGSKRLADAKVRPVADIAYGPCQLGGTEDGSAFCDGTGSQRVDPVALVDLETAFRTVIACGPCTAFRALNAGSWGW